MPIKVVDPDTGAETEAFTADELAAKTKEIEDAAAKKIAENEAHMKEKLDQFQQGKTAAQLAEEEKQGKRDAEIAEAKRLAGEAVAGQVASETRRLETLKKSAIASLVGNDPELTKKMEDAWVLINIDAKEDADFFKKAEMAANMSGINHQGTIGPGGMSFGGGFAPQVNKKKEVDEATHSTFRGALPGMDDFLSKPKEDTK